MAKKATVKKIAKKKREKKPAYKFREIATTVSAAIGDAFAEYQTLAEEMRGWADGMPEGKQGSPKHDEVEAAADELESHADEPDVPEFLQGIVVKTTEMYNRNKRRANSRDIRLSNAQSLMQAARDAVQEFIDQDDAGLEPGDNDAKVDEKENAWDTRKDEAEQLVNELDEHTEFDVEFPGMFG